MRFFSTVPDEVCHKDLVEGIRVMEVIHVAVNELFLNRSVEYLDVTIWLWMSGVVEEMGKTVLFTGEVEVFLKLTAVIRLDSSGHKGGHRGEPGKEVPAIYRGIWLIGIGEGKSCTHIQCGKDRDSIHLHKIAGKPRRNPFSSQFLFGFMLS